MITGTSLNHPTIQAKLFDAMHEASKTKHSAYVLNKSGAPIMRVNIGEAHRRRHLADVSTTTSLQVFCSAGRDITSSVIKSIRANGWNVL